jgi:hypothetical protein
MEASMGKKLRKDFEIGFRQVAESKGMAFINWTGEHSNSHPCYAYSYAGHIYGNHSGVEDGIRDGKQAARKNIRIRAQH